MKTNTEPAPYNYLGFSVFNEKDYDLANLPSLISPALAKHYQIIPLREECGILHLGLANPDDQALLNTLSFQLAIQIQAVYIPNELLTKLIENYCNDLTRHSTFVIKDLEESATLKTQQETLKYDGPLIQFVNHTLHDAIQKSASDIHLEPFEMDYRIRYRIDGLLYETAVIPYTLAQRFIRRLKVMAYLDIAENRLPQDGHISWQGKAKRDIRINICPNVLGEKIVLRILQGEESLLELTSLGFTQQQYNLFISQLTKPQGMIIVTGPTGSGKTLTLYSACQYLNNITKNISSIEDPVEIRLKGINQLNINPKIGLTFTEGLKTLLRQDPDIIMLGEIRDAEAAKIAIQAAQTGHLVLSTLHSNSAIETLLRLKSFGISSYDIATSITLIMAQRLIRKLCSLCKIKVNDATYQPHGCSACVQGYRGRQAIYEMFYISPAIKAMLMHDNSLTQLESHLIEQGFITLSMAGSAKVSAGITTLAEISRVVSM